MSNQPYWKTKKTPQASSSHIYDGRCTTTNKAASPLNCAGLPHSSLSTQPSVPYPLINLNISYSHGCDRYWVHAQENTLATQAGFWGSGLLFIQILLHFAWLGHSWISAFPSTSVFTRYFPWDRWSLVMWWISSAVPGINQTSPRVAAK